VKKHDFKTQSKTFTYDEYPEITAEDMAKSRFRVGMNDVTRKEWLSAVGKKQRINRLGAC